MWLLHGAPRPGERDMSAADAGWVTGTTTEHAESWTGYSLASGEDLTGDGNDDVALGAPKHGNDDLGRVSVIAGRSM